VISLEEAQERILAAVKPLPGKTLKLLDASGRFLAEPVYSSIDLPPYDNSAMDGYAVRSADLVAAAREQPVILPLAETATAGSGKEICLQPGTCVRIFTGAMLPTDADAVIMQEDVAATLRPPVRVTFTEPVKPWENVRLRGEDVREKALLLEAGELLKAQKLSLLSAAGLAGVPVRPSPTVALITTGDELSQPGRPLPAGKIYESNQCGLAAALQNLNIEPKCAHVPDNLEMTTRALSLAMGACDVVITVGGASVGDMDFVKQSFESLGVNLDFWRVALRPGKPFVFGKKGWTLIFGLPGNPVSAFVTFFLLVRPALLKMQGAANIQPPTSWGKLTEPLANRADRRHFARVILDSNGEVKSAGSQASHFLSSMAAANGLVDVPPATTLPVGQLVPVLRWT